MYFIYHSSFTTSLPTISTDSCLGGILADEMGLGKTLELISLVLLRPCPLRTQELALFDLDADSELPGELAYCSSQECGVGDPSDDDDNRTVAMCDESVFCVCGGALLSMESTIACNKCHSPLLQHKECVQFNPLVELIDINGQTDVVRLRYICPLCWNRVG